VLSQDQANGLFKKLRRCSRASDVEVTFTAGRFALTRFANNTILQNVSDESCEVSVRSVFAGPEGIRTARAGTNKLDDDSLRRAVEASETLARVQQPEADLLPMYEPQGDGTVTAVSSRYSEETAAMDAFARAAEVEKMVAVARREKLNSAGTFSSGEHVSALFNSREVERWQRETHAQASVTMTAADSSGWQKANSTTAGDLDSASLAEIAAHKALRSASPREVEAGPCTVILEPAAVLDIVGFMFWDFSAAALLEERSFLNNRLGQRIFGGNINIVDDVRHPLQTGPGFDGEGVSRQRLELVRDGVVQQVACARASAERWRKSPLAAQHAGMQATGHGFPLPNEMGEAPVNIVFQLPGGARPQSVDEIVASTERGLLVTRLWYIREVDSYEKILTGMTRDGTFRVEDGRIRYGVRNLRFNESLLHLLNNVSAMSEPVRASGEESFDMVVPAMKVEGFNFTEVTRF